MSDVTKVLKIFPVAGKIIGLVNDALKIVRLVHAAMLGGIIVEALAAELAHPAPGAVNPSISYALATLSVAIVGSVFVVRKTLALPSAKALAEHGDDAIAQQQWKMGHLLTYALCQGLGIFGVVLRFLGASFQDSLPFYISGFIMLFFFAPRNPAAGAHADTSQSRMA